MALLSNEHSLFKKLNLIANDDTPSDFYNFLVNKLINVFKTKIEEINIDDKARGSYERLKKFYIERPFIKKAVMTIPYNVSTLSMVKYVK